MVKIRLIPRCSEGFNSSEGQGRLCERTLPDFAYFRLLNALLKAFLERVWQECGRLFVQRLGEWRQLSSGEECSICSSAAWTSSLEAFRCHDGRKIKQAQRCGSCLTNTQLADGPPRNAFPTAVWPQWEQPKPNQLSSAAHKGTAVLGRDSNTWRDQMSWKMWESVRSLLCGLCPSELSGQRYGGLLGGQLQS